MIPLYFVAENKTSWPQLKTPTSHKLDLVEASKEFAIIPRKRKTPERRAEIMSDETLKEGDSLTA